VETRLSRLRRRRRWRRGARAAAAGAVLMSAVPLLPGHEGARPGYVASGEPDTRHPLIGAAPNPRGPFAEPKPPDRPPGPVSGVAQPGPFASGIPGVVLAAYQLAERLQATSQPGCHLHWWMLAGVGRVESNHADNGRLNLYGSTLSPILGPRLDGGNGFAAVRDTDGGTLDGDTTWDRAVGPMQFIPSAWRKFGVDAGGDRVADPNNIFDASASAGRYLCDGGRNLDDPGQLRAAAFSYNPSDAYVQAVLAWMRVYASGVAVVPVDARLVSASPPQPEQSQPAESGQPSQNSGDSGGPPPPQQSGGNPPPGGQNPPPGGDPQPLSPECLVDLQRLGLDPAKLGLRSEPQCHDYLLTLGPLRVGGAPASPPPAPAPASGQPSLLGSPAPR
jgi:hypothetical protein